jgi:RNA polymerase sigma-70 factor (ECF subfamily)
MLESAEFFALAMSDPAPPGPSVPAAPNAEDTFKLLERARSGDSAALDALFARYLPPLRRWASGRLPQWARDAADTQDLVQETLLNAFRKIGAFQPQHEGALQAYLRQALMNRVRDELRRHSRRGQPAALDSGIEDSTESPLERAIGRERLEQYEDALQRLRPDDRDIIIARVEMGFSYVEITTLLGKPSVAATRKAAERALVRLAVELKRHG